MSNHDVTYIIDPITEDLEGQLLEDTTLDLNVGSHSGLHFIIATITTDDFQQGATALADSLRDRGVRINRMDLDLVNQSEIAVRCGLSRQAVSNWINTHHHLSPFPLPHTMAGGPLWAWSRVNEWLHCTGKNSADDSDSATPEQVDAFNTAWRQRSKVEIQRVAYQDIPEAGRPRIAPPVESVSWSATGVRVGA